MRFLSIPLAGLLALAIIVACHNNPTAPVTDGPELSGVAMDSDGGVVIQVTKKKKVNNKVRKDDVVEGQCKRPFTLISSGQTGWDSTVDENDNGHICYKAVGNGRKKK